MKKIKLLIASIFMIGIGLKSYSQDINIPLNDAREIAKTLVAYPIVLREYSLLGDLYEQEKITVGLLERKIKLLEEQSSNKDIIIEAYEEQKDLYEKELNNKKNHLYLYANTLPSGGLQLHIKEKFFVQGGIRYNKVINKVDYVVGLGIKIF